MNLFKQVYKKKIILNKNFFLYFLGQKSEIYFKGNYGIILYKLSNIYIVKKTKSIYTFSFFNIKNYINFIKHFFTIYKNIFYIFSVRLKIKGLGYRIRKIAKNFYYFFFNYTNMFYFNIPVNVILKWYKKRIILLSSNFIILKLLFSNILILKKIGPYRLRGLRYPRQVIFIKKGGKKT